MRKTSTRGARATTLGSMPGESENVGIAAVAAPVAILEVVEGSFAVVAASPTFATLAGAPITGPDARIPSGRLRANADRVRDAIAGLGAGENEVTFELSVGAEGAPARAFVVRRDGARFVGTLLNATLDWRFEQIVQKSPDIIAIIDRNYRHVFVNDAITTASGARPADFEGKDHRELGLDEALVTSFQAVYKRVFETGLEGEKEFEFTAPDGRVVSYASRVVPLIGPDGRCEVIISSARDVTERKRAAAARLDLERKLQETQRLEALGLLAGGVAHDFNNLLTAILGMASVARVNSPPTGIVRRSLTAIEEACESAAALCAQMLAYAGRGRAPAEPLRITDLAQATADLVRASASKNVVLDLSLPASLPTVLADRSQLQQVILNLMLNATEALAGGEGRVVVRAFTVDASEVDWSMAIVAPGAAGKALVTLQIEDNGVGMAPETRARIFDPFFTTKFSGRGLGLAASLGIVRAHSGGLLVRSAPGEGSVFTIYLPVSNVSAEPAEAACGVVAVEGRAVRVLVVDDERHVRDAAAMMLESAGHRVTLAASGHEALRMCEGAEAPCDLVLLDLTMPGLDGFETLTRLRARHPKLQVIVMSGYAESELQRRASADEHHDFLQKPFRTEQLEALIREVLRRG